MHEIDVIVAPIRFGGGTRLKILEALAHRMPLVSTTMGAEGIDVVDGTHALLRNDPKGFADAVLLLHRSAELRDRLTANGAALFAERYEWAIGVDKVAACASEAMAATTASGR